MARQEIHPDAVVGVRYNETASGVGFASRSRIGIFFCRPFFPFLGFGVYMQNLASFGIPMEEGRDSNVDRWEVAI